MCCLRLRPLQAVNDALLRQMFEPFGTVLHTAVLYDATTSESPYHASSSSLGNSASFFKLSYFMWDNFNCRHQPWLWLCPHGG